MSSSPSLSKSNIATPPAMLSTMYFFSDEDALTKSIPEDLATSVNVTSIETRPASAMVSANERHATEIRSASAYGIQLLIFIPDSSGQSNLDNFDSFEEKISSGK